MQLFQNFSATNTCPSSYAGLLLIETGFDSALVSILFSTNFVSSTYNFLSNSSGWGKVVVIDYTKNFIIRSILV